MNKGKKERKEGEFSVGQLIGGGGVCMAYFLSDARNIYTLLLHIPICSPQASPHLLLNLSASFLLPCCPVCCFKQFESTTERKLFTNYCSW